jgi:hypothetical protein
MPLRFDSENLNRLCPGCGAVARHPTKDDCIAALRSASATLQFRLNSQAWVKGHPALRKRPLESQGRRKRYENGAGLPAVPRNRR